MMLSFLCLLEMDLVFIYIFDVIQKKRAIYTDENEKMKQVMHKFCLLSKGAQRIHFN